MEPISGQILIVEDEPNIRSGLRDILVNDGQNVMDVSSGEQALRILDSWNGEVAIVDICMPGMSGIELLEQLHAKYRHLPVILLTGHGTLETAMAAVRSGAYDYLLKPAQPEAIRQIVRQALLEARRRREQAYLIQALRTGLSRLDRLPGVSDAGAPDQDEGRHINVGQLHIDQRAHEVYRDGEPLQLTPSEYQLLLTLAERLDQVVDYKTLVELTLGYKVEIWEAKELIKRHVFALRQKIEPDSSNPCYLLNVRGVGYRLASAIKREIQE